MADYAGRPLRRVLMTADCLGGVWDYSLTLAKALSERGVKVYLAALGGPLADDQRAAASSIFGLSLVESEWKLEWMPDAGDHVLRSGEWLLDLERTLAPDIVHVNGYAHAALPFKAPVVCVAHSCVPSWYAAVWGEEPPEEYDPYRARTRAGLAAAHMVIAPSRAMAAQLAFHHGLGTPAHVIPNGRDPQDFTAGPKDDLILSVGRVWDEAKNIAALDAIAPTLGSPVAVAGTCQHPDGQERRPQNIAVLGRLPTAELRDWYARAAVFCLPVRYEPFGLAALEAALSGCALVLGDIPSQREIWGEAALYVRPDDHDTLRRTLNSLMADPARRADLAHRARIRARQYTVAAMAGEYLDAYAALLGQTRRLAAE